MSLRGGVRGVWLLWALLCAAGWTVRAEKPADLPRPQGYVADFAGVLDQDSVQRIANLAHELETKAHARIEVVTIHTLAGEPIENFATELEDRWKVGDAKEHRGALVIFAIDDHKRRIEVGDGLEGVLPDAKVGEIGDAVIPQLRAGQYGAAAFTIEAAMAGAIAQDAGVALDPSVLAGAGTVRQPRRQGSQPVSNWIGLLVMIGIIVVIGAASRGGRRYGPGGGGGWWWFLLGSLLGGGRGGGWSGGDGDGGSRGGGSDGGGSSDGGFHDDGGFGGGSSGGGASGDW